MSDWESTDQKPWTWGDFYQKAKARGVTLRVIDDTKNLGNVAGPVLLMERRDESGEVRRVILPAGCTPDRRMMLVRQEETSKILGIPAQKWVAVM